MTAQGWRSLVFRRACACAPAEGDLLGPHKASYKIAPEGQRILLPPSVGSIAFNFKGEPEPVVLCEKCETPFERRPADGTSPQEPAATEG